MTNREHFDVYERASDIVGAIPKGAFLTTRSGDKTNSMVIGWGTLGNVWGKPVFIAYVRKSRFTRELLDANPEFTVNVPDGPYDKEIYRIFGSRSGRDMDKIAAAGVTLVDGEKVSVPGILELPMTLECKVLYRQPQEVSLIPKDIQDRFYPRNAADSSTDDHIAYIGEIVGAYILS
ncbi:MAG: flavin reductase family protein [Candidatus Methanomethylophilaceae archaeon]|nr:flavin reductase family protein [Candidatus Methanomethylophilaceae archaeon]